VSVAEGREAQRLESVAATPAHATHRPMLRDVEDKHAWLECLRAAAVLMSIGRHPHALTPSMLADVLFQDYRQRCQ